MSPSLVAGPRSRRRPGRAGCPAANSQGGGSCDLVAAAWELPPPAARVPGRAASDQAATAPAVRSSRRRDPQHVAHAADGVNQPWLTLVDLAPQIADTGLHHVALARRIVVPDVIEYLASAEQNMTRSSPKFTAPSSAGTPPPCEQPSNEQSSEGRCSHQLTSALSLPHCLDHSFTAAGSPGSRSTTSLWTLSSGPSSPPCRTGNDPGR
jgi:hypothetical protein